MISTPCNKNAIPEVKKVLEYLAQLEGNGILTGQHSVDLNFCLILQISVWKQEMRHV